jgi:hypothetical protein
MGAGQSTTLSQASICKFSEEQISILDNKIRDINVFLIQFRQKRETFDDYNKFVEEQALSKTEVKMPPSLKKIQLLEKIVKILNEFKTILKIITDLCKKYQQRGCEDVNVENDINTFILENMSQAETLFNEFRRNIEIPNDRDLNEPIDILMKIIEEFKNVEVIKSEMKTMCAEQKRIAEQKTVTKMYSMHGGKSSRTRSKKRKQMKMKIKKSSKHLSKTRNNKKKYNKHAKK